MEANRSTAPARRLEDFVRGQAAGMADALDALAVIIEDHEEAERIREVLAEHFGGKIADSFDVEAAIKDAVDVLEGGLEPGRADKLAEGKLGSLIVGLARERELDRACLEAERERSREAVKQSQALLVILHQIYAIAKGTGSTPTDPLPDNIKPVDVLVEVHDGIMRAGSRGWSASGQRGVA